MACSRSPRKCAPNRERLSRRAYPDNHGGPRPSRERAWPREIRSWSSIARHWKLKWLGPTLVSWCRGSAGGLRAGNRPEESAEADAQLRAAKARLASVESAPTQEQQTELVRAVTGARQRVAELEKGRPELITELEAAVAVANDRVERLISAQRATPVPAPGHPYLHQT